MLPMFEIAHDKIQDLLNQAVVKAQSKNLIPKVEAIEFSLERPQIEKHGDFASNLALKLSNKVKLTPIVLARKLIELIPENEIIEHVWEEEPGFINIEISSQWLQHQIEVIINLGSNYGVAISKNQTIILEFVSINPTGPLHHGHLWGAVIGSSLANILEVSGYKIIKEYYVNDHGNQLDLFINSLYARYRENAGVEFKFPDDGYKGNYVNDMGKELWVTYGDKYLKMNETDAIKEIRKIGLQLMLESIQKDLKLVGVHFDNWFNESNLFSTGEYIDIISELEEKELIIKRDGATWFITSAMGESKDDVIVKSSGEVTYFASDIVYHANKFKKRKFDQGINIWGADHQGHIPRLKAALESIDIDSNRLKFIVTQMVSLKKGNEKVKASKRSGEFVTLRELVDEVGKDVCRFFFLSRTPESHMTFDLELAKEESNKNPVYYLQYGFARISSLLRNASANNLDWRLGNVKFLHDDYEIALMKKLTGFPELLEVISETLQPHRLANYAIELATSFHLFYQNCRVISSDSSDIDLTLSRLKLTKSTEIVLGKTLFLMGINAPEKM